MTATEAKELTTEASEAYHAETATLYATELSAIYELITAACADRKFYIDLQASNAPERIRILKYLATLGYSLSEYQALRGKFVSRISWESAN